MTRSGRPRPSAATGCVTTSTSCPGPRRSSRSAPPRARSPASWRPCANQAGNRSPATTFRWRLFAHGLTLQSTRLRTHSPGIRKRLADATCETQDIIGEIRTAIFDLPPETAQLRKRLHEIIAELTAETSLQTVVRISGPLGVVSAELAEHTARGLPDAVARSGPHNLTERAEHAGGTFIVEAPPGGGTKVVRSAPVS
ncbi:hypothetical protein [Amycolatopsis acidicola]|uniref:hypothetical protein n=1 Tax=Amycolatopsis acidicola TaxID=2596893 RepID=UPI001FB58E5E|nr:hypothetical protein [Amycolatopsis acidicola]